MWKNFNRIAAGLGALAIFLGVGTSAIAGGAPPEGHARGLAIAAPAAAAGFAISAPAAAAGFAVDIRELLPATSVLREQAQSGTAADRRALREAKRGQLAPPEKAGVEAGLAWMEDGHLLQRIRQGWYGFLPTLGGFPSGSGQAFGVIWGKSGIGSRYSDEMTPNRLDLRGSAALSLKGYYLGLFETAVHRIGGSPIHANVHFGYQRNAAEAFYGLGPDSKLDDESTYRFDVAGAGALFWWQAPSWFYVGGGIGYRDFDVSPGEREDLPSVEDVFVLPGLTDQGEFITYDGFVQIDWRNKGNPYRGGLYSVRWTQWIDREFDSFNFGDLDIELQQYIPFRMNKRVLALRARTVLTSEDAGQTVPFYLMPTLGGNADLRGYEYSRFTDKNMLLMSAEYRVEIWLAMDLAFFADAGKVFEERSQLNFDDLKTNYGVGLRVKTTQSTFLRADFAFGGEAFRYMITFDNSFNTLPIFNRILKAAQ